MVRPGQGKRVEVVEIKREEGGIERVVVGVEEGEDEADPNDDSDGGGFMVDL
jgi:hypothetical protein